MKAKKKLIRMVIKIVPSSQFNLRYDLFVERDCKRNEAN